MEKEDDYIYDDIFPRPKNWKVTENIKKANTTSVEEYKKEVKDNINNSDKVDDKKRTITGAKTNVENLTYREIFKRIIQHPSDKSKAIGAGLLAAATIATAGISIHALAKFIDEKNNKTNVTEKDNQEYVHKPFNSLEDDKINTVEDVKKDFLNRYLQAYNKMYKTNYNIYNTLINISLPADGYVFKVNDKLVTRGNNPEVTRSALDKMGNVETEKGHTTLVQIISSVGDEMIVLGTYDKNSGEFIYSGMQMEDLQNEEFIVPELDKLEINNELMKNVSDVIQAGKAEGQQSIDIRIRRYIQCTQKLDRESEIKSDGPEIGY